MVEWGNVAEWVGAVGTIGALGAALLLLEKEIASLKNERESVNEERELRRREHARAIAVWLEGDLMPNVAASGPTDTWIRVKKNSECAFWANFVKILDASGA